MYISAGGGYHGILNGVDFWSIQQRIHLTDLHIYGDYRIHVTIPHSCAKKGEKKLTYHPLILSLNFRPK